MKRTSVSSCIEIWGCRYINNADNRRIEDKNVKILQVEPGATDSDYIVEFVRLNDKEDKENAGSDNKRKRN